MKQLNRPPDRSGASLPLLVLLCAIVLAGCAPGRAVPSVGDIAPAFSLPSVSGNEVQLSDYSGEPVLLYFHMAVG